MEKKVYFLQEMVASGYPLESWIKDYKDQYRDTHPHILKCINKSIEIIKGKMNNNSDNLKEVEAITSEAIKLLSFEKELDPEFNYSSLPFCVIDSVFSIGVKYESVKKVVKTVSQKLNIPTYSLSGKNDRKTIISTSDFVDTLHTHKDDLTNYFGNKQRTSSTNGILKADAVLKFLEVLKNQGVEDFKDIDSVLNDDIFENAIRAIKGQSSGISLKYFYMLAGNNDLIKPDRMIQRFLTKILSRTPSERECQELLMSVSKNISDKIGREISPLIFDNLIWNYQRSLPKIKD